MPIAEVMARPSATASNTGTTAITITATLEVNAASQIRPPPMAITPTISNPVTSPIPALPASCSPQVRLSRVELRLRAPTGPTSSTTSTGTIRKVISDQAAAPITASTSPTRSPACCSTPSPTPAVAAIAAQPTIFFQRARAAAQPVSALSGCPAKRVMTVETSATLQKITTV